MQHIRIHLKPTLVSHTIDDESNAQNQIGTEVLGFEGFETY